jgi:hypothetical protein
MVLTYYSCKNNQITNASNIPSGCSTLKDNEKNNVSGSLINNKLITYNFYVVDKDANQFSKCNASVQISSNKNYKLSASSVSSCSIIQ